MKIKKIGHCCLIIEQDGVKLLTDPGGWSEGQNDEIDIDAVLITHEHPDHLHIESLKTILSNNREAKVITNSAVGKILSEEGIKFEIVEDGGSTEVKGILIEGYGTKHGEIYKEVGQVMNTGFFIGNKLFYPGDDLYNPGKPVDVLALPVVAPWLSFREAMAYVLEINPNVAFPVHDGMLIEGRVGPIYKVPEVELKKLGKKFINLQPGEEIEV